MKTEQFHIKPKSYQLHLQNHFVIKHPLYQKNTWKWTQNTNSYKFYNISMKKQKAAKRQKGLITEKTHQTLYAYSYKNIAPPIVFPK